jgi:primosomal protein N' (replication factor Y)
LICHYCGHRQRPPDVCPNCQNPSVKAKGKGTQKIEEEIKNIFPSSEVLRMDADTTRGIGSHGRILVAFEKGDIDILVGTQMVAKGHDFPNVTLVGVVSADIGLNLPDFRSSEYTFQLLTQVSGRSGRGEIAGEVVIQTYAPTNYSILSAQKQDYNAFYKQEITKREELTYPPFSKIIRLITQSRDEEKAKTTAEELGKILRGKIPLNSPLAKGENPELVQGSTLQEQINPPLSPFTKGGIGEDSKGGKRGLEQSFLQILGPAPAPLTKIRNSYRYHIIIKGKSVIETHKLVIDSLKELKEKTSLYKVKITVDVDPVSML